MADGTSLAFPAGPLPIPDRRRPTAPVPPERPLGLLRAFRALRANPITAFPRVAYERPYYVTPQGARLIVMSDPEAVERVLVDNAAAYLKSPQQQRRIQPALGEGLLTAEGDRWRAERRIAAPLFSPRAVGLLLGDMAQAAQELSARWAAPREAVVDLADAYQVLTYDIVSRTVFSGSLDADRAHLHEHMAVYFDTVGRVDLMSFLNLPDWVPNPAVRRAAPSLKVFHDAVARAVAERRAARAAGEPPSGDLFDRLIAARDPETGEAMPEPLLFDNALTFLAAGHETSANALVWLSYLLARFPWADEALAAEVRPFEGQAVDAATLDRLPFARRLVEEAMRLYPPVPFLGRQAAEPDRLAGRDIPAGTNLVIAPWLIHRHRQLWEEPDLFAPDRFLPGRREAIPRGAYLPFGLGPRICIGLAFAMQEILTALAVLVPAWRFELVDGDAGIMPQSRITLRPVDGMRLRVVPR